MRLLLLVSSIIVSFVSGDHSQPDTWSATDGLGRALVSHDEVGDIKSNKFVGIFYFLWNEGSKPGPFDVTKILQQSGGDIINAQWGPLYTFHHWSKPYFDYYLQDDEFVIRKHAQMLADAGIDTLIYDVTNGYTYDNIWAKIGDVFTDMRAQGIKVPQFTFIAWTNGAQTVQHLYNVLYSQNRYSDLWFRWNGKPLLFADFDGLSQQLKDFFTVRKSWAWTGPDGWYGNGNGRWPWIDNYPQGLGKNEWGQTEQTCVAIGGHPTSNLGRSYDGPTQTQPAQSNANVGHYFQQQWDRALQIDPSFIFVTGWNEWIAQRFVQTNELNIPFLGKHWPIGTSYFVDQFDQEFSRDAEPMAGGHGDNYYYQLVNYIRKFKGVRRPELPTGPKTITINQDFSQWQGVGPHYTDDLWDIPSRNHPQYGAQHVQLTDYSQKNDLAVMQVARDSSNLYFYARSTRAWTNGNQYVWLYLNTDNNYNTG
ncbi:unnamed protein product, partial [Didymodactylos carnosus]